MLALHWHRTDSALAPPADQRGARSTGLSPSTELVESFRTRIVASAPAFTATNVADCLWAFTRLRHSPHPRPRPRPRPRAAADARAPLGPSIPPGNAVAEALLRRGVASAAQLDAASLIKLAWANARSALRPAQRLH